MLEKKVNIKNHKYVFAFFVIVFLLSCQNKVFFSREKIQRYSNFNPATPSITQFLDVFVCVEDYKRVVKTDIVTLQRIYSQYYTKKYDRFEPFLFDALNKKLSLSKLFFNSNENLIFQVDTNISKEYSVNDISFFIKKYCKKVDNNSYAISKLYMRKPYLNSILYYFFVSNYEINVNDYAGEIYVSYHD